MKIKFKNISIKNFLSFGASITLFDLSKSPFTLIVGENGSGKSTILIDALHFVLFGKIIRKGIKLSQVVNNINKKNCEVCLDFEIDDIKYRIERGLSPDFLRLFKNGELKDERASKVLIQKEIEDILQFDQDTFKNISVLSLNNSKSFMDLTPEETRNVVENILGIQIYSQMLDKAKEILKENKNKIKVIDKDFIIYDNLVKDNKDKLKKIKDLKDGFEFKRRETLFKLNNDLTQLNIDFTEQEKKIIKDIIEPLYPKEIVDLDSHMMKIKDNISEQRGLISETVTNIKNIIKEIDKENESDKFFINTENCPICKTKLNESHRKEELKKIRDRVNELEETKKELLNKSTLLKDNILILENSFNSTNERKQLLINKFDNEKKIFDEESNKQLLIKDNINVIKHRIEIIEKEIEDVKNDSIDKHIDSLINMDVIKEYEEKLNSIILDKEKTENEILYYEYIKDLLSDGGIKAQVIKNDLPFLNKTINNYLKDFERTYTITFDEQFNIVIGGYSKRGLSYYNLSEGEKKRIDISILLAFVRLSRQKNSISCNILAFDEVLETSLDEDGKRVLVDNLLNNMIKMNIVDNIFIISHNKNLILPDAEIITVYKEGEFSKIKLDNDHI